MANVEKNKAFMQALEAAWKELSEEEQKQRTPQDFLHAAYADLQRDEGIRPKIYSVLGFTSEGIDLGLEQMFGESIVDGVAHHTLDNHEELAGAITGERQWDFILIHESRKKERRAGVNPATHEYQIRLGDEKISLWDYQHHTHIVLITEDPGRELQFRTPGFLFGRRRPTSPADAQKFRAYLNNLYDTKVSNHAIQNIDLLAYALTAGTGVKLAEGVQPHAYTPPLLQRAAEIARRVELKHSAFDVLADTKARLGIQGAKSGVTAPDARYRP